jgi:glyoxylase-like metal-dependent hydrolase (beta-lactamase superfamily II)/rhodanese-related sulfurtransferase
VIFEQYYLQCLSHASYLIGDATTGRAVVVDPQRDISQYLADASANGLHIERVIETHFHADFVSGHLELAEATGAVISYGDGARPEYDFEPLADGQRLSLGEVQLEILATPGHTPESISVVVYEKPGDVVPYGVLTGDALFIGDVGRPDLLTSVGVTADELARQLYRSLHEKLLRLPDETRVYPAHGAGSACGKALSTETVSTIGAQRRENYALAPMTEDQFVEAVTQGQSVAPLYFAFNASVNKQVRELLHDADPPRPLSWDEVVAAREAGAVLLDTRDATDFALGHVRGALNIGLGGRFAEYAGNVITADRSIVLFSDPGTEHEAKVRLARIGFDRVVGYVDEPVRRLTEHQDAVVHASRLGAGDLEAARAAGDELQIVDVRNEGEFRLGAVDGAMHVPLASITRRAGELDADRRTVVYCAGGYRSSIAASYLRAVGFRDVADLLGGYGAWAALHEPQTTRR